jgi:circadian clock protein KaiC
MNNTTENRLLTGITGLDEVLAGGLLPGRAYLLRGGPGTGKTTMGLHFLVAGAAKGEKALFITLEEAEASLRENAAKMGLDLSGIDFLDISPGPDYFSQVQTYDIFSPAEVEREPLTRTITEAVERLNPVRVFLDPLTQFRYLSTDVFQFRKQVLSFLRFLTQRGATVVFTSENSFAMPDDDLQFMADGIIKLDFDDLGRNVTIAKLRGSNFTGRSHSMKLDAGGISVYPRLVPQTHGVTFNTDTISSGLPDLDKLLQGGLERGTVTFLSGPTGVGKTTLGGQFMKAAALRGERSALFSFEEETEIMLRRFEAIGIGARDTIKTGNLLIEKVRPLQFTPDEFACRVRYEVEEKHTRIVMIDSISGYRLSMHGQDLVSHLHALVKYMQRMGVTVLVAVETAQLTGDFRVTDYEISYLADNIVFLRYLEIDGRMRKAIGVLKKRLTDFEKNLREFEITSDGIKIGQPLTSLRGILSGAPTWVNREDGK